MDPQFGGASYSPSTDYLGGQTMVQPGVRQSGATRAWAISSVALGSIYLLSVGFLILVGCLFGNVSTHPQIHQQIHQYHGPMPVPGAFVVSGLMSLLSVALAFCFVAAGGGVLARFELGRKALVLTSGAAIVVSLVWLGAVWSIFTDPNMIAMMVASAPQNPQMPAPMDIHQLMRMSTMVVVGMAAIVSAIEVLYCGFLCHHMTSRNARADMKTI